MDAKTGNIYNPEEQEQLEKKMRDTLIPIPDEILDQVQALNRKQRKVWAAEEKQRTKQALKNGR